VLVSAERKFDGDTSLKVLVELVPKAGGDGGAVVATDALRTIVDKIASFEPERQPVSGRGVVEVVDFQHRVELMQVRDVVIEVEAGEEKVRPLVAAASRESCRVQEVGTAVGGPPEVLSEADIRLDGQAIGVLMDAAVAGRDIEVHARGQERACVLIANERVLGSDADFGEARVTAEFFNWPRMEKVLPTKPPLPPHK